MNASDRLIRIDGLRQLAHYICVSAEDTGDVEGRKALSNLEFLLECQREHIIGLSSQLQPTPLNGGEAVPSEDEALQR